MLQVKQIDVVVHRVSQERVDDEAVEHADEIERLPLFDRTADGQQRVATENASWHERSDQRSLVGLRCHRTNTKPWKFVVERLSPILPTSQERLPPASLIDPIPRWRVIGVELPDHFPLVEGKRSGGGRRQEQAAVGRHVQL